MAFAQWHWKLTMVLCKCANNSLDVTHLSFILCLFLSLFFFALPHSIYLWKKRRNSARKKSVNDVVTENLVFDWLNSTSHFPHSTIIVKQKRRRRDFTEFYRCWFMASKWTDPAHKSRNGKFGKMDYIYKPLTTFNWFLL